MTSLTSIQGFPSASVGPLLGMSTMRNSPSATQPLSKLSQPTRCRGDSWSTRSIQENFFLSDVVTDLNHSRKDIPRA